MTIAQKAVFIFVSTLVLNFIAYFPQKTYNKDVNREPLQFSVYNPYINYLYSPERVCPLRQALSLSCFLLLSVVNKSSFVQAQRRDTLPESRL